MAQGLRNPLLLLAVVAAGLATTVVVVVMRDDEPDYSTQEMFVEYVHPNPDLKPDFIFPEALRTTHLGLNRFIDRFFRICAEGKYSEFRLLYTNMPGQAISAERFESSFNVLKNARIIELRKLPELKQFDGPTWILVADFDLESYAPVSQTRENTIRLAIGREDDRWKLLGPVTKDALDQIDAYEKALRMKASAASAPRS